MNNNQHTLLTQSVKHLFVGRSKELKLFKEVLTAAVPPYKVLYFYGTGGIGKSYLLHEFEYIAASTDTLVIKMDSRDFIQTPEKFIEHVFTLLEATTNTQFLTNNYDLRNLLQILRDLSVNQKIVIAIDSYENMNALDRWLRQVFIKNLPNNLLIIMAGRNPLSGEWIESPFWQQTTKSVALKDFTLKQTEQFLDYYKITTKDTVKTVWQFTNGHPLTLALAVLATNDNPPAAFKDQTHQILIELTKRWLNEVKTEELHHLIEAAALFYRFNQESLAVVLKQEISRKAFQQLLTLSFIKPVEKGWSMHDLIRDAIIADLQLRDPDHFKRLKLRSAEFYYKKTINTRSPADAASFFYQIGDEFISSVFFHDQLHESMYLEPVAAYNFQEVKDFFTTIKANVSASDAQFYNRQTNESFYFHASKEHNLKETELIDASYVEKIGYKGTHLLKNQNNNTLGLSIIVPIHKKTLEILAKEPVSRAYFSRLSKTDYNEYAVSETERSGWFIRFLDYINPNDTSARSFMLYNLFPLLVTDGRIIVSTPLIFFQEILENFGFVKIPNATHYDYGENRPCPTYLLDVRGPKLALYLKQFLHQNTISKEMDTIQRTFSFTDRETEIVRLILDEKSNTTIAAKLYLAEVTVKKHITRIFRKVNVKNRAQLIKRLMEII